MALVPHKFWRHIVNSVATAVYCAGLVRCSSSTGCSLPPPAHQPATNSPPLNHRLGAVGSRDTSWTSHPPTIAQLPADETSSCLWESGDRHYLNLGRLRAIAARLLVSGFVLRIHIRIYPHRHTYTHTHSDALIIHHTVTILTCRDCRQDKHYLPVTRF